VSTRQINLAAAAARVQAASGPGDARSSIVPELSTPSTGVPGWSHFLPTEREVSERWRGKQRTETVEDMLNHWQVAACRQAIRLPTHRYIIELDPQDCDVVATDLIAADLDVPIEGSDEKRTGRRAKRFSARRHFDRAIDALDYGHAVFEQAGRLDDAGYWRLTDLAPVPQWTIDDANSWEIDNHGNLIRVVQWGCNPPVKIPTDHLVTFTWQGRPGDPRGKSMLRPLTGAWSMSDRLIRVMGFSAEKNGMGVPVGKVAPGSPLAVKQKLESLLAGYAAGEDTCLVLETDEDIAKSVMLMGVTGSTPDIVGMLKYLDEIIARATLTMLLQLGQTETGSRALGTTFDDLLAMFHDTIVDWYCDTMTMQLVEPWVDRNRGEDAPAPRLVWKRRPDEAPEDDVVDAEVVDDTAQPPPAAPIAARRRGPAQTTLARRQRAARTAFAAVAGRELRRDPTPVELAAATDFGQLEREHVAAVDDLAAVLLRDRDELAATAVAIVAAMPTVDPLTLGGALGPLLAAHANAMDTAPLVTMLTATAAQGVAQVVGEAARQGVTITPDVDYAARAAVEANELQRRMAVQITEACAAAARTLAPAAAVQASGGRGLLRKLRPAPRMATVEAGAIEDFLSSLSPAAAEQAAAGATSRANGGGRFGAIASAPTERVIASEILDVATCGPCSAVDGREYEDIEDAMLDYPSLGAFFDCEGGERCRGTAVAIFEGEV